LEKARVLARSEETVAQCFVLDYGVCRRGRCNHVPTYKSRSRAWTWKLVMDGGACGRRGFTDAVFGQQVVLYSPTNIYGWLLQCCMAGGCIDRTVLSRGASATGPPLMQLAQRSSVNLPIGGLHVVCVSCQPETASISCARPVCKIATDEMLEGKKINPVARMHNYR
jgi:hypothetical protein